jgi:hypothetical protein
MNCTHCDNKELFFLGIITGSCAALLCAFVGFVVGKII